MSNKSFLTHWSTLHTYFLGLILVVFSSWGRYLATGSMLVDDNPIRNNAVYIVVLMYCVGLSLNGWSYYKLLKAGELSIRQIRNLGFGIVSLGALMLPMLSNDSLLYIATGELFNQGMVNYVEAELIQKSNFVDYVSQDWLDCPNHYGPFLLYIFALVTWVGKTFAGSMIVYKVVVWLCGLSIVQIVYAFFKNIKIDDVSPSLIHWIKSSKGMLLLVFCPVLWLQGLGQMHVDIIIMLLIMVMVYSLYYSRWVLASIAVTLIALSKTMYAAVFIPFYFAYLYFNFGFNWPKLIKYSLVFALVFSVLSVAFYKPVWQGVETLTTAINYHESKKPSRSHVEVVTDIIFYSQQLFGEGSSLAVDQIATADDGLQDSKRLISDPVTKFFKYVGLLLAIWVFFGLFFAKDKADIFHMFAKVLLVVFCFYSPIFHPWYYMIALPFLIFTYRDSWVKYLAFVFTFSCFHEIAFTIPRDSLLYIPTVLFVLFMVISFFWFFKKHFIMETWRLISAKTKA